MGKDDVKLLTMWASPFCMRVKVALAEKEIAYEEIQENDLLTCKSDLLLTSNPVHKQVPVLFHDDKPICESTNIITYLDEAFPAKPLFPECAYGRSRARFWADYIDRKVHPAGRAIWSTKEKDEVEAAKNNFLEIMKYLDGTLGDKDYFNGDKFGFVDILLIGLTTWFPAYEKYGDFKLEDHYPKLAAWITRSWARETVSESLTSPEKITNIVIMLRKMHGLE
ncbi:putative glutathione transferase [Helianthus annuus]|uniref:glutathione transferase n=1 Tax=Helianthus annuus TaxID=4232 RepID=A0A251S434_HELAN|nr:probable glutathione S-transferase parC [Helianthus annuus]KAF5762559.1 putative glutathione transferase [Helianthus annuus]KAJ0440274.1 putative glutathione transferase [Helianthus annuus]KAJ0462652.1 putative glutathione transferase [Helianthus annuus]KAJ0643045.1 putative glutathione transferase [Helianthus annuus]KAJ0646911.1 putative glutathione transferase [Helianthus annuus]